MSHLMRCNFDPFDDSENADLSFAFSPDAPIEEQVANIIFRFTEYRKLHKQISKALDLITNDHYQIKEVAVLLELKQPIQRMLFAREALHKLDAAFEKDIDNCNKFLEDLEKIYEPGKSKKSST